MASRKFEGIAMLSMYDDEEDDDDMDEAEEHGNQDNRDGEKADGEQPGDASMVDVDATAAVDSGNDDNARGGVDEENSVRSEQQLSQATVPEKRSRRGTLVDYGHDEVAMSPEAEEGETAGGGGILSTNADSCDKTLQVTHQISEPLQSDAMNEIMVDTDGRNTAEAVAEDNNGVDPLDTFLPPPLKIKCSEELQRKIQKFLELKRAGKSFNEEVRKKKDYRNPDFLLHAVRYQDIDQIGSCFNKDVFDPHGFDKSDYYDEIEADSRREPERISQEKKNRQSLDFVSGGRQNTVVEADSRREPERISQEKKNRQSLDFVSGGRQNTVVGAVTKHNVPLSGTTMAATGLNFLPPAADSIPRDGRQNKKSKWDKIDGTHVTVSSSANAGGFSLGHQKRREVEEKRSSERRLDRRS